MSASAVRVEHPAPNAITVCSQCGEETPPEISRTFLVGPDEILCYECALGRGAIYDEVSETWVVAPDSSTVRVIPEDA